MQLNVTLAQIEKNYDKTILIHKFPSRIKKFSLFLEKTVASLFQMHVKSLVPATFRDVNVVRLWLPLFDCFSVNYVCFLQQLI